MKWRGVTCSWPGALTLLALAYPVGASADQFVALDLTYEATAQNTMDSHYEVPPAMGTPANWRTPVDYANGTVHIRYEVMTKPSGAATLLNLCFANASNYACMPYPPSYTQTGVYQFSAPFSAFWQGDLVDWAMGVNKVMLILKDQDEVKVQGNSMFYPYEMRATITIVSPGSTYVPPDIEPGPTPPRAGSGGAGGRGGAGAAGMGGRDGASGRSGASGRGGAGGSGEAGGAAVDAGSFDASIPPAAPEASDAASIDDDFFDDGTPIGRLPPQPTAATRDKRAPPPGDLQGRSCALVTPRTGGGASLPFLIGVAALAFGYRLNLRSRRRRTRTR